MDTGKPTENLAVSTTDGAKDVASERVGDMIGPYRLIEQLGEGGFGIVWLAERTEPMVQRVAIKVLKPGMDSRAVIGRFEQERQALAMMDHPNVARVFDAGATARGLPYFVMEHVRGEPITHYCDRHMLSTARRLELFAQACDAIEHAHAKGIIHRDLKPSNVLVGGDSDRPVVKVIDFGIAKAINAMAQQQSIFTERGQLVGTPEYMSPEQADMNAASIDTRTDVYSLGVVLYELLSGTLPFDSTSLRAAGFAEIQRIIREVDPPRPATRLSSMGDRADEIAKRRHTRVRELCIELTRELEWIPLKAIRKDRAERYRSAAQLADDVRNYLSGQPLIAGPESAAYRVRKFVRRHRVGVSVAALVLAMIAGSSVLMGVLLAKTRAAQKQADVAARAARIEADKSKAVTAFVSDMLRSADPGRDGRQVKVASVLDRAVPAIGRAATTQPEVAASMHEVVGATYESLGLYEDAAKQFRACLDLRTVALGPTHPDTLQAKANLAPSLLPLGKSEESKALLDEAVAGLIATRGAEDRSTLLARASMAKWHHETGKIEEATRLFREVSDVGLRILPENDDQMPMWLGTLGVLLTDTGKLDEAKTYADKALERSRRTLGEEHPTTQYCMNVLARWHQLRGEFEPAEKLYREAYAIGLRVLGEEHQTTLYWMNNVARILQDQKKFDQAAEIYERLVAVQARVMGEENADTLMMTSNWARCYQDLKQFEKAEPLMRKVVEAGRRTLTIDHLNVMIWQNNLAKLLELKGTPDQAQPLYAEVVASARKNLPETHNVRATFELNLGLCEALLGHNDAAEPLLLGAEKAMTSIFPAGNPTLKQVRTKIADFYEKWGKSEKAAEWKAKA